MFSAVFVALLGIVSAGLILAGVAFYAGWEAQSQMQRALDHLRKRLYKA